MAQLCYCHNQEENTNYHLLLTEKWWEWWRVNQKSTMNYEVLEDRWHCPQSRAAREAALKERSPWSSTLKLDWSLLLITQTKKRNFWRNSVVTWKSFGHNEQQYVWRREGEAINPKKTKPVVKHGAGSIMLLGFIAASWSAAVKKVNGIMKKDHFQILQKIFSLSVEYWLLGAVWCPTGQWPQTHKKKWKRNQARI